MRINIDNVASLQVGTTIEVLDRARFDDVRWSDATRTLAVVARAWDGDSVTLVSVDPNPQGIGVYHWDLFEFEGRLACCSGAHEVRVRTVSSVDALLVAKLGELTR
jgi:hypothetical protein